MVPNLAKCSKNYVARLWGYLGYEAMIDSTHIAASGEKKK